MNIHRSRASGYGLLRALFRLGLVFSFLLAACAQAVKDATPTTSAQAPSSVPSQEATFTVTASGAIATPGETVASPTLIPTLSPGTYLNPVFDRDFPDPDVLQLGSQYYAYSTNSKDGNIPVAGSANLVDWHGMGDALPELPAWAVQEYGWAWAPDVITGTGEAPFLMFFTARFAYGQGGTQCIGLATGEQPQGPYTPRGDAPFVCQIEQGGSIDPASFIDEDGTRYILWKNDGNTGGGQSWIQIQRLSADGFTLEGDPVKLITADQIWEGVLVEGPTLWKQDGRYYLFYSANAFNTPKYAVGYAVADNLFGPYQKSKDPLLSTTLPAGIVGPGGQDVVLDANGDTWLLFHSWTATGYRRLNLARLVWENGRPQVIGLSRDPQPAP